MSKKSKDKKTPPRTRNADRGAAVSGGVGGHQSANLASNTVEDRAVPSNTTSVHEVILNQIFKYSLFRKLKGRNIDFLKGVFYRKNTKGKAKDICFKVDNKIVFNKKVFYPYNFVNCIEKVKSKNIILVIIMTLKTQTNLQLLNQKYLIKSLIEFSLRFSKLKSLIKILKYDIITMFFTQENPVEQVYNEAGRLEQNTPNDVSFGTVNMEDLGEESIISLSDGADNGDDFESSTMSNGAEDTIVTDQRATSTPAGVLRVGTASDAPPRVTASSVPPRVTAAAGRRSSLSISDEIDSVPAISCAAQVLAQQNNAEETPSVAKGKSKKNASKGKAPKRRNSGDNTGNTGNNAGEDVDQEGGESKKRKVNKKSYAEVAKEGHFMCDIRADNGEQLIQSDYDWLAIQLMFHLIEFQKKNKKKQAWKVQASGMSQSAVWLGAETQECVDFLRQAVPQIEPPERNENDNRREYQYRFYGPNELPFRYVRWRIPYMWLRVDASDLEAMIRAANPELWVTFQRPDGTERSPILRLKKRVYDSRDAVPDNGTGFVTLLIEMEEDVFKILVEQCNGILRIGANQGKLEGGGMKAALKAFRGEDDADAPDGANDENEDDQDDDDEMENAQETDKKDKEKPDNV